MEVLLILRTGTWIRLSLDCLSLFFSLNPCHCFHSSFLLIIQNVSSVGFWILYLTTSIAGKKRPYTLDQIKSNNPRPQTFFFFLFTTFGLVILRQKWVWVSHCVKNMISLNVSQKILSGKTIPPVTKQNVNSHQYISYLNE